MVATEATSLPSCQVPGSGRAAPAQGMLADQVIKPAHCRLDYTFLLCPTLRFTYLGRVRTIGGQVQYSALQPRFGIPSRTRTQFLLLATVLIPTIVFTADYSAPDVAVLDRDNHRSPAQTPRCRCPHTRINSTPRGPTPNCLNY